MHTQALILKTFPQHEQKALVLDEKYGKVYAKLGVFSKVSLCQGMLIQGTFFPSSGGAYILKNVDPVYAPFDQANHDLEFLHTFLFTLQKTIPLHANFSGIILYTKYVYENFFELNEHQKKLVLLFIFLKSGVFPEDPWLYKLLIENAFTIHELFLDSRMEQKVAHTFSQCWEQISLQKE